MRLIVIGDTKGKKNGINEKVFKKLLKESCKLNPLPQFLVICGDSVAGSKNEVEFEAQLKRFRAILEGYHKDKPVIPVIGNHEVNINPSDQIGRAHV
jgi:3',5'-cyclic-AMP phosphodiesterase